MFARLQLGGEEDDGAAWSEIELGAQLVRVGGGCASCKVRVVDGVGHEELGHVRAEVMGPVVAVAGADGKRGGDGGTEKLKEEMFGGECRETALAVGEP